MKSAYSSPFSLPSRSEYAAYDSQPRLHGSSITDFGSWDGKNQKLMPDAGFWSQGHSDKTQTNAIERKQYAVPQKPTSSPKTKKYAFYQICYYPNQDKLYEFRACIFETNLEKVNYTFYKPVTSEMISKLKSKIPLAHYKIYACVYAKDLPKPNIDELKKVISPILGGTDTGFLGYASWAGTN